jgi:hypothetical protein
VLSSSYPPRKKLGLIKFATPADYCLVCFLIAIAIMRGITIINIIIIIIIVYHLPFQQSSGFAMYAPAGCRHGLEQCLQLGSRMLSSTY